MSTAAAWVDRTGEYAFQRVEDRTSTRVRDLDCGHRIDPSEPYLYFVAKLIGIAGLIQLRTCDVCRRSAHHY